MRGHEPRATEDRRMISSAQEGWAIESGSCWLNGGKRVSISIKHKTFYCCHR